MVERLTLGVVQSLGKRQGVCDVVIDQRGPADMAAINNWETTHCCTLPADIKQFYLTSNGFLLTWKVKIKDDVIPVGRMEINAVTRLDKIAGYACNAKDGKLGSYSLSEIDISADEDPSGIYPHFDSRSRVFELDPCNNLGKMCLVFHNTKQGVPGKEADYWFLDKALRWHFLTADFSSYFRIMISNLGLPQWHYLYTDVGISPAVQQWYSLYAPLSVESDANTDSSGSSSINAAEPVANHVDINRVFKGKEKKKPLPNASTNQAGYRRKAGSPQPNKAQQALRGSASAALMKSATSPFYR
ncbi:TPGS2 [Bugula neritina]|uniref:TPGS2 n=1 Tax=Bugula neritina TaxID=10212 RepID=A0A7J7J4S9_BUGNE|nr:TPGS2 [Bugula neritina]